MTDIAWYGFGNFGTPLANRFQNKGHRILPMEYDGHGREGIKQFIGQDHIDEGLTLSECQVAAFCLPRTDDVEAIVKCHGSEMPPLLIDFSTGSPDAVLRMSKWAREHNRRYYDCPLSGSLETIADGRVTAFVGAKENSDIELQGILSVISDKVFYFGFPSGGARAKLTNQFLHISIMGLISDALTYAKRQELDIDLLVKAWSCSSAGNKMLDRFGELILSGQHTCQFSLLMALKDLNAVREQHSQSHIDSGYLAASIELYETAMKSGMGALNFSAVCLLEGVGY